MKFRQYDVAVVGGGPAGLRLATQLARSGFDAVVLDDRNKIGHGKICTGIIGAEAFTRLKLPTESIISSIQRLKFFSPAGRMVDYTHPELLAHVVDRSQFDFNLAQRASEAGVEILNESRVDSARVDHDGVRLGYRQGRERLPKHLNCRLLVLATGVNFTLNRALGLGHACDFLNAAQAHIRVRDLKCTHCFAGSQVAPGAFGWVVPLQQGLARIGLMVEGKAAPYFNRLLERMSDLRVDSQQQIQPDFKPIAQRFQGKTFGNRVLAVGEAAGQIKTTTGGGIYYGMLGAEVAATTLTESLLQGRYDEAFLSSYEDRWRQQLLGELETGYYFRKLFSRLSDRTIESFFKLAAVNGLLPLIKRKATFDWHSDLLNSLARYDVIPRLLGLDSPRVEFSGQATRT